MFLPGWDEIIRLKEQLAASPVLGRSNQYLVLPLHSMIAKEEQRRIFVRPPRGIRKVGSKHKGIWPQHDCSTQQVA